MRCVSKQKAGGQLLVYRSARQGFPQLCARASSSAYRRACQYAAAGHAPRHAGAVAGCHRLGR